MPITFVAALLISIAMQVAGYLLTSKKKQSRPDAMSEQDGPTAESGKPRPVVMGSVTIESPNIYGWWDKEMVRRDVSAGGKK